MLLSLVLSSSLMAQAGQFPVIDPSGLGLARGASTEGAEGLGGGFGADGLAAMGADHFVAFLAGFPVPPHFQHFIPAGVECEQPQYFEVQGIVFVLSRDIPPVPQSLNRGRGELSLYGSSMDCAAEIGGAPSAYVFFRGRYSFDCGERVVGSGQSAQVTSLAGFKASGADRISLVLPGGFELDSVLLVPCRVAELHGYSVGLVFGGGVDVFHERSIAQALAHVNNYLCGIFAGVA